LQQTDTDAEATTKMKLVLLKPEKGHTMKSLLEKIDKKGAKGLSVGGDADAAG